MNSCIVIPHVLVPPSYCFRESVIVFYFLLSEPIDINHVNTAAHLETWVASFSFYSTTDAPPSSCNGEIGSVVESTRVDSKNVLPPVRTGLQ